MTRLSARCAVRASLASTEAMWPGCAISAHECHRCTRALQGASRAQPHPSRRHLRMLSQAVHMLSAKQRRDTFYKYEKRIRELSTQEKVRLSAPQRAGMREDACSQTSGAWTRSRGHIYGLRARDPQAHSLHSLHRTCCCR